MGKWIPLALTAALALGCAPKDEGGLASAGAPEPLERRQASTSAETKADGHDSKPTLQPVAQIALRNRAVIRKASLSIRVDKVEDAERELNGIVHGLGGYLDNVSSTDLAGPSATIVITAKVPAPRFDEAIQRFEGMGVRLAKTVSAEDVTKQLVDMDARVKTLLAEEETVRNMLRRAADTNQILSLQSRLSELRSVIESVAGQRKAIGEAAALSTITVTLTQAAVTASTGPDPNWLGQVVGEASSSATQALRVVVSGVVWAAFFSPAWGLALVFAWWAIKRARTAGRVQVAGGHKWDMSADGPSA